MLSIMKLTYLNQEDFLVHLTKNERTFITNHLHDFI